MVAPAAIEPPADRASLPGWPAVGLASPLVRVLIRPLAEH
jgi:hypothetical protein